MPKPRPMTDSWSNRLLRLFVVFEKGLPVTRPEDAGGERHRGRYPGNRGKNGQHDEDNPGVLGAAYYRYPLVVIYVIISVIAS